MIPVYLQRGNEHVPRRGNSNPPGCAMADASRAGILWGKVATNKIGLGDFQKHTEGDLVMTKYLLTIITIVGVGLLAGTVFFPKTGSVAAESPHSTAVFDSDGKRKLPTGYRAWVFVG